MALMRSHLHISLLHICIGLAACGPVSKNSPKEVTQGSPLARGFSTSIIATMGNTTIYIPKYTTPTHTCTLPIMSYSRLITSEVESHSTSFSIWSSMMAPSTSVTSYTSPSLSTTYSPETIHGTASALEITVSLTKPMGGAATSSSMVINSAVTSLVTVIPGGDDEQNEDWEMDPSDTGISNLEPSQPEISVVQNNSQEGMLYCPIQVSERTEIQFYLSTYYICNSGNNRYYLCPLDIPVSCGLGCYPTGSTCGVLDGKEIIVPLDNHLRVMPVQPQSFSYTPVFMTPPPSMTLRTPNTFLSMSTKLSNEKEGTVLTIPSNLLESYLPTAKTLDIGPTFIATSLETSKATSLESEDSKSLSLKPTNSLSGTALSITPS